MVTVQVYVANVPLDRVVKVVRPHMTGGTAWAGTGFDASDAPLEPSVVLRGGTTDLTALQGAIAALLAEYGERTAFVEVWDATSGRYYGPQVWKAAQPVQGFVVAYKAVAAA